MVRYLFYTIGDLTYQSHLVVPITNHKYVTHDYWPLTKPGECM